MQKTVSTNHLKKNILNYVEGPILFTAPHSKKVYRGGPAYNQKKRTHLRQLYTSYFAVNLATTVKLTGYNCNSFCVWGKSSMIDDNDLDPNYLIDQNIEKSNFHKTIHKWAAYHMKISKEKQKPIVPLLHIDIHGKFDRQNNCQIQVGYQPMKVHWTHDPLIKLLQKYFEEETGSIFEGLKFGKFSCKFNTSPCLHGYWGDGVYTMTQQAIMLGIPSFQIEIPAMVRAKLFKDPKLMDKFRLGIQNLYLNVITPYWQKCYLAKQRIPLVNLQLAKSLQCSIKNKGQVEQAHNQLRLMEQKAQLQLTVKKI